MSALINALPWAVALLVVVAVLIVLRRPLGKLGRLAARTAGGLCALFAFSHVGGLVGVTLGVNLWNALVLGVLGVPGFGLLLMLNWALGAGL
ncbi:MAG: transcriptional regulator [Clostridiales bacterium]|nr:transcriptional regulator [Clostridiales bacterium]